MFGPKDSRASILLRVSDMFLDQLRAGLSSPPKTGSHQRLPSLVFRVNFLSASVLLPMNSVKRACFFPEHA